MVVDNADGLVANQIGVVAVFLEKRAVSLSIDDAAPFLGEVVHFADEVTVEMIPNFSRRLEIAAPFCRLLRETFLVEIAVEFSPRISSALHLAAHGEGRRFLPRRRACECPKELTDISAVPRECQPAKQGCQKLPSRAGRLSLQIVGNLAPVLGKLDHHLFVQPNIHFRGVFFVSLIVQLVGQVLARCSAAIQIKQFHQIDDGFTPIQFLLFLFRERVEHRDDINVCLG